MVAKLAINGGQKIIKKRIGSSWPLYDNNEVVSLKKVLANRVWGGTVHGPMVETLNRKLAYYCQAKYGVAVSCGTTAIQLGLMAVGVSLKDEVIVPAYTFIGSVLPILHNCGVPVFVDIKPDTLTLNPETIEKAITARTKAILPVHLGGQPADMSPIRRIAKKYGLKIVEDCAQAHGAIYQGKKVGSLGDVGAFSFQQSKLMTSGEGGMITTNNRGFAELINYTLSKFGRVKGGEWYVHHRFSWKHVMTEFQAAILLAQFERLEEQIKKKDQNAFYLTSLLNKIEGIEVLSPSKDTTRHSRFFLALRYKKNLFDNIPVEKFVKACQAEGIPLNRLFPVSANRQPMFNWVGKSVVGGKGLKFRSMKTPESDRACEEICVIHHQSFLGNQDEMDLVFKTFKKVRENYRELLS